MEELQFVLITLAIIALIIFGVVFSVMYVSYKYDVEVAESNIIRVFVEEKLVYEGKKAFINISSGGMTTTVTVYKKLFPFEITDRIYSNNNIKIN